MRVFNTASWPSHRNPDLALPAEMVRYLATLCVGLCTYVNHFLPLQKSVIELTRFVFQVRCVEVFTDFYKTKKPKQKLSWMSSFGTCTLDSVDYAKLQIQLIMTPYQVTVKILLKEHLLTFKDRLALHCFNSL